MNHDVQLADPKSRFKTVIFVIAIAIVGSIAILAIESSANDIQSWIEIGILSIADKPALTALVIAVFLAPIILISIYMFSVATQIANAQRFPVPGTKVIRDTKILTGRAAIQRARIIQSLAVLVVFATLMLGINLWSLLQKLLA